MLRPENSEMASNSSLQPENEPKKSTKNGFDVLVTAAHEIRTPLSVIMGFSEILASDKISEDEQRQLASSIHQHSKFLRDIINDLMDLARIESNGPAGLELTRVDITKFIEAFIKSLTLESTQCAMIGDHEIRMKNRLSAPTEVLIDEIKIKRVIQNLLSNAAKYSKSDSPITIQTNATLLNNRECVCIDFIDNGCGLRRDELTEVFKPFWRSKHNSPDTPGTGIGLAIVKQVIEAHGGTTRIHSTLDVGTIVSILIPRAHLSQPEA